MTVPASWNKKVIPAIMAFILLSLTSYGNGAVKEVSKGSQKKNGDTPAAVKKTVPEETPPPQRQRTGPDAVWKIPAQVPLEVFEGEWFECTKEAQADMACIATLMAKHQASPQAVEFTRALQGTGFMASFTKTGPVDLATVTIPGGDFGPLYYLVNGDPFIISIEDEAAGDKVDIKKDPLYTELSQTYPGIAIGLRSPQVKYLATEPLPGGGQRYNFTFPLLNECDTCLVKGWTLVLGFDFDSKGKLLCLTPKIEKSLPGK